MFYSYAYNYEDTKGILYVVWSHFIFIGCWICKKIKHSEMDKLITYIRNNEVVKVYRVITYVHLKSLIV